MALSQFSPCDPLRHWGRVGTRQAFLCTKTFVPAERLSHARLREALQRLSTQAPGHLGTPPSFHFFYIASSYAYKTEQAIDTSLLALTLVTPPLDRRKVVVFVLVYCLKDPITLVKAGRLDRTRLKLRW